jgi:hypothetical protein
MLPERGFRRLACVLSLAGFMAGLWLLYYTYTRNEYWFFHDLGSLISYVVMLTIWPWPVFYAVRWIVRGFLNHGD